MNVFESLRELADTVREHAPAALDELRRFVATVDRIATALEERNKSDDRIVGEVRELLHELFEDDDEERRS